MTSLLPLVLCLALLGAFAVAAGSQTETAGDAMMHDYLAGQAEYLHSTWTEDITSREEWERRRPKLREEYLYMLGLWPLPEKTPLQPVVTGTLDGDGYVVENLHYQRRPGLYLTGNLYRPAKIEPGQRLPAVFYVCGHSGRGRDGNKTAFQDHGIWFARHGYVCLIVDTLQLGEIAAIHHGTYREQRWWWHSRGYTSAGVECWNGIRGIDYLVSRPDVDPERIAVTGISGGGAATIWIAAADERVKVAVPVSGMSDLRSYVEDRIVNGHCDCMFLHNAFHWPWVRIAALIAPRPLLFVNSDQDGLFPMDGNERIINRLERVYSLYGAGDLVDSLVSIGGHDYRQDIRQGVYRFLNTYLKDDPRPVTDSEVDLVTGSGSNTRHPIKPENLRVFPTDADLPKDERNTTIDQSFVPLAEVVPPAKGEFEAWKDGLLAELRRVSFGTFPGRIPAAALVRQATADTTVLQTELGIRIALRRDVGEPPEKPLRLLLVITPPGEELDAADWLEETRQQRDLVYWVDSRGVGDTRWSAKNPPNYVARSHVLIGQTVDTGRVWDIVAAARYLHERHDGKLPVYLVGSRGAAVLAAYAALWEPDIAGVIAHQPLLSHMEEGAPQFLNVLRVCDVPEVLGMLAPRPLTLILADQNRADGVKSAYRAAGKSGRLRMVAPR